MASGLQWRELLGPMSKSAKGALESAREFGDGFRKEEQVLWACEHHHSHLAVTLRLSVGSFSPAVFPSSSFPIVFIILRVPVTLPARIHGWTQPWTHGGVECGVQCEYETASRNGDSTALGAA